MITKRSKPVAQRVPIPRQSRSLFGHMRNTVQIKGDVVAAISEEWSALSGDEDHLFAMVLRKSRVHRGSGKK